MTMCFSQFELCFWLPSPRLGVFFTLTKLFHGARMVSGWLVCTILWWFVSEPFSLFQQSILAKGVESRFHAAGCFDALGRSRAFVRQLVFWDVGISMHFWHLPSLVLGLEPGPGLRMCTFIDMTTRIDHGASWAIAMPTLERTPSLVRRSCGIIWFWWLIMGDKRNQQTNWIYQLYQ